MSAHTAGTSAPTGPDELPVYAAVLRAPGPAGTVVALRLTPLPAPAPVPDLDHWPYGLLTRIAVPLEGRRWHIADHADAVHVPASEAAEVYHALVDQYERLGYTTA